MTPLSEAALQVAAGQVGQHEDPRGSNWGKPVQDYLASVNIDFPASWCMAFVYWCYKQAAAVSRVDNPLFKTGGVLNQWNMRRGNQAHVPEAGDILILDYGKGLGHTGLIESIEGETLHTIEGNSNNTGSRQGDTVVRHTRAIGDLKIKGFLRF